MQFRTKNILVFSILGIIAILGLAFTNLNIDNTKNNNDKIKIVTSFYPIYIATSNIILDNQNVELVNLTQPQTGCLHDYQLTPNDMITLETADIFIINGGGIESFIEDIVKEYPNLVIINSSDGIEFLQSDPVQHEDHIHSQSNAHLWISIPKYIQQIKNIQQELNRYKIYTDSDKYIAKLQNLNNKMHTELSQIKNKDIIIFHDSFEYFAQELGLNIRHMIVMEDDTSLSAGEIADIINEIKKYNIKVLFTEEQYSPQIAASIADETDANVYILDSCVGGDMDKDSYINAMEKNLEVMKGALLNE